MTQIEIDAMNRQLLTILQSKISPGQLITAAVCIRVDATGLELVFLNENTAPDILSLLRQKADEIHITREPLL